MPSVFALLVEAGRGEKDGLPEDAVGAALLCYASAATELEAVEETTELLRVAGFAPMEISVVEGSDPFPAARARAEADDAVVVAQVTPFFN